MTPSFPPAFPFSALQGQSLLQMALLLTTVDPLIGGVLIEGPRGTAKSTAARALAGLLPNGQFINLPLSTTEEQLVGSLDLEAALQSGDVRFRPGLFARAHAGVLYVDEVNLLADALVDLLLDVCASGINRIERDGISHSHPARLVLIGTMNPEEGTLRPQLLDRFGLFVRLEAHLTPTEREAIVRIRLAFDADPVAFSGQYAADEAALAARIAQAQSLLPRIAFDDVSHTQVAQRCYAAAVEGVRADLVMLRAARAHAALAGRTDIEATDIEAVAELVLAHRRSSQQQQPETPPSHADQQSQPETGSSTDTEDWGALPPEAPPITPVKSLRPLPIKKA